MRVTQNKFESTSEQVWEKLGASLGVTRSKFEINSEQV